MAVLGGSDGDDDIEHGTPVASPRPNKPVPWRGKRKEITGEASWISSVINLVNTSMRTLSQSHALIVLILF